MYIAYTLHELTMSSYGKSKLSIFLQEQAKLSVTCITRRSSRILVFHEPRAFGIPIFTQ